MEDIVRVIRILEYVGPREWVERTMNHSFADPEGKMVGAGRGIRELTRTAPEPWPSPDVTKAVSHG